jgi:hypothetical protein
MKASDGVMGRWRIRRIDEAFLNMPERMLDKGTPRTSSPYAYLDDDNDQEEEEGSSQ